MPGLVRACPTRCAAAARWNGGLRAVAHVEDALAAPLPAPLPAEPRPSPAGAERELPFKPFYQFSPQKIGCVQFITAGINECFLPPLYEAVDLLRIKGRKKKKPTCHTSAAGSRGREDYMQLPRTRCELHGLIKPLKRKHGDRGSREQTRTKRGGAERASVASRGHGSAGSTGARGQGDVGGDVSRGRRRGGRAEPRGATACAVGARVVSPTWDTPARPQALAPAPAPAPCIPLAHPAPLTAELKRRWQMLQEMNCFFLSGAGTPKVWLITAFCTGSIWKGREGRGRLGARLRRPPRHGTATRHAPHPPRSPRSRCTLLTHGVSWSGRLQRQSCPVCPGGTPRTGQRALRRRLFLSFLNHP